MPHHWGSLRVQLMLLVILAAVPAFAFTAYQTAQDRERETVSAQANALLVSRRIADEFQRLTGETRGLLAGLGQDPAVLADDAACSARLAGLLNRYPVYANLAAFGPDGSLICSGSALPQPAASLDSPWFVLVQTSRDLVVGDYEATGLAGRSGQLMALAIRDSAGSIRAVVAAVLDTEWLGDFIAASPLAPGTTITLLDRNSTVVTRYPDPARWTGKPWPAPGVKPSIAPDEAVSEARDLDGAECLLVAVPIGDAAAPAGSVIAGIPVDQAFAASTINLWRSVALIALVTAIVLGMTWFGDKFLVGRQVSALADATRAIAGGRPETRTGLAGTSGELGDLAASIDQMAQALERREKERVEMSAALVESEERYRDLFENASDLILSVALDGRFLYVNKAWRETLGYEIDSSSGPTFFDTLDPSARADGERLFERVMSGEKIAQLELTFIARNGQRILVEGSASSKFVDGKPSALRGIFRDITSRRQVEARMLYLSSHDALTGLYNRGYFEEEMTRLAHSRRLPISIVVADVDGLKHTNDTRGHAAGDELLKQAAAVMRSSFRQEDLIARIGGDEFAVLLPQSDAAAAQQAIARVQQNIAARNETSGGPRLHLSLGTATAAMGEMLMETLTAADAAMYADKTARQMHRDSMR